MKINDTIEFNTQVFNNYKSILIMDSFMQTLSNIKLYTKKKKK